MPEAAAYVLFSAMGACYVASVLARVHVHPRVLPEASRPPAPVTASNADRIVDTPESIMLPTVPQQSTGAHDVDRVCCVIHAWSPAPSPQPSVRQGQAS